MALRDRFRSPDLIDPTLVVRPRHGGEFGWRDREDRISHRETEDFREEVREGHVWMHVLFEIDSRG